MGEFSSASYDVECSADTVGSIYEVLEVLLYEVIGITSVQGSGKMVKVVSTLMSAISKVLIFTVICESIQTQRRSA